MKTRNSFLKYGNSFNVHFFRIVDIELFSLQPVLGGFGNWPWCDKHEGGLADKKYRFALTSISKPVPKCIGLARRRLGRGGRYWI